MRILVTGGRGTLGTPLVAELALRGHTVVSCDLVHSRFPNEVRCDIGEYRQLLKLVESFRPDLVYNLAAEFGRMNGEEYYEAVWRTNVVGMKNILMLQSQFGFRLVHFSSSEVYGDYRGVMTEDAMNEAQIGDVRQKNDYAISKWVNELQILNATDREHGETVRFRLFNVYGPGEFYTPYRSMVTIFSYSALHRLPYNVYLGYKRTATFVDDAIRTFANVIDNFIPGRVYNISGSQYCDVKDISDMVLREAGSDDSLVTYLDFDAHNTVNKCADSSLAISELNHSASTTFEVGIPATVAWHRKVYGL